MKTCICLVVLLALLTVLIQPAASDLSNGHLSKPNLDRDKSMERLLGLGVIYPYPYFQKPRYRFPVYDRNGRGSLFYGYGGREKSPFKSYKKNIDLRNNMTEPCNGCRMPVIISEV
ncbi:unnamed protein product [Allacma fusca]|uniref:Uncharacterized protein n=1 Tax=Allacma fusca TaxID=39272 RepID=A0A8J2PKS1_9HEXA|nr:unnamed protein product [Allacma fusca]